jgi:hypothetical protein
MPLPTPPEIELPSSFLLLSLSIHWPVRDQAPAGRLLVLTRNSRLSSVAEAFMEMVTGVVLSFRRERELRMPAAPK